MIYSSYVINLPSLKANEKNHNLNTLQSNLKESKKKRELRKSKKR